MVEKNDRIISLITHLTSKFGAQNFKIRDHWEGDLTAIGFTDNSEKHLVYVGTHGLNEGQYFVSLENPSKGEHPYEPAGDFNNVSLTEFEKIFVAHLKIKTERNDVDI
ncbi:hypothetical protein BH10BAC4_BH10BAC4_13390 [soil metagenome]